MRSDDRQNMNHNNSINFGYHIAHYLLLNSHCLIQAMCASFCALYTIFTRLVTSLVARGQQLKAAYTVYDLPSKLLVNYSPSKLHQTEMLADVEHNIKTRHWQN